MLIFILNLSVITIIVINSKIAWDGLTVISSLTRQLDASQEKALAVNTLTKRSSLAILVLPQICHRHPDGEWKNIAKVQDRRSGYKKNGLLNQFLMGVLDSRLRSFRSIL